MIPLHLPGLGQADSAPSGDVPTLAAVMVGATVAVAVGVFKGPLWASILSGAGAALVTKVAIDKAATTA